MSAAPIGTTVASAGTEIVSSGGLTSDAIVDTGGNFIGQVTSGGFGPSVGAPIAMGYVDAAHSAEGVALAVVVRDVARPAHVARLPFVPTHYYRG